MEQKYLKWFGELGLLMGKTPVNRPFSIFVMGL